jgi:hypothetical protein
VQAIKIDNLIENSILPIAFKKRKKVIPVLGFLKIPISGTSPHQRSQFCESCLPMVRNPFEALLGFEG